MKTVTVRDDLKNIIKYTVLKQNRIRSLNAKLIQNLKRLPVQLTNLIEEFIEKRPKNTTKNVALYSSPELQIFLDTLMPELKTAVFELLPDFVEYEKNCNLIHQTIMFLNENCPVDNTEQEQVLLCLEEINPLSQLIIRQTQLSKRLYYTVGLNIKVIKTLNATAERLLAPYNRNEQSAFFLLHNDTISFAYMLRQACVWELHSKWDTLNNLSPLRRDSSHSFSSTVELLNNFLSTENKEHINRFTKEEMDRLYCFRYTSYIRRQEEKSLPHEIHELKLDSYLNGFNSKIISTQSNELKKNILKSNKKLLESYLKLDKLIAAQLGRLHSVYLNIDQLNARERTGLFRTLVMLKADVLRATQHAQLIKDNIYQTALQMQDQASEDQNKSILYENTVHVINAILERDKKLYIQIKEQVDQYLEKYKKLYEQTGDQLDQSFSSRALRCYRFFCYIQATIVKVATIAVQCVGKVVGFIGNLFTYESISFRARKNCRATELVVASPTSPATQSTNEFPISEQAAIPCRPLIT